MSLGHQLYHTALAGPWYERMEREGINPKVREYAEDVLTYAFQNLEEVVLQDWFSCYDEDASTIRVEYSADQDGFDDAYYINYVAFLENPAGSFDKSARVLRFDALSASEEPLTDSDKVYFDEIAEVMEAMLEELCQMFVEDDLVGC